MTVDQSAWLLSQLPAGEGWVKCFDSATDDTVPLLPIGSANMVTYTFANGCVLTLRTSGTEPKLKYYAEMSSKTGADAARASLEEMMEVVVRNMLQPEENGLAPRPTE